MRCTGEVMNLYPLIQCLADGCYHSGSELGERLGVSRTAIWKQVQQLTEYGLSYDSDRKRGYCLTQPLDLLDPVSLRQSLSAQAHTADLVLEVLPKVDSTNAEMLRRFQAERPIDRHVLLAEMQTEGRGRRGRHWFSPFASSLSVTLGFTYEGAAQGLSGFSLVVGVAVERVLSRFGFNAVGLKWPNDIYLGDRKLGGILIEISGDLGGPCQLIVGVGLNVQRCDHFELDTTAYHPGFLSDVMSSLPSRTQLAAALIDAIVEDFQLFSRSGFAPFQSVWNGAHCWKNRNVQLIQGDRIEPVTLGDVNAEGELSVQLETGEWRLLNSGELSLRVSP